MRITNLYDGSLWFMLLLMAFPGHAFMLNAAITTDLTTYYHTLDKQFTLLMLFQLALELIMVVKMRRRYGKQYWSHVTGNSVHNQRIERLDRYLNISI